MSQCFHKRCVTALRVARAASRDFARCLCASFCAIFLLPLRRLIRRTRPCIARPVLPPLPLAGEGWGEGEIKHERSKVPYHSPHPIPALLATPDSGDSSGCFERQVPIKTSTSDSRQLSERRALGLEVEFCRAPVEPPESGRPQRKRRVVDSGLAFSLLTFFWRSKRK